ncbi:unnamed protein product, partial [Mesorhabditis spiculigera]
MILRIWLLFATFLRPTVTEYVAPYLNLTRRCVDYGCERSYDWTETGGLIECFGQDVDNIYHYGPSIFPMRKTYISNEDGTLQWTAIHCSQYELQKAHKTLIFLDVAPYGYLFNCPTMRNDICEECPIGTLPEMLSGDLDEACKLVVLPPEHELGLIEGLSFFVRNQLDAMSITYELDQPCAAWVFQSSCYQCDEGYLPALIGIGRISHCVAAIETTDPERPTRPDCPRGQMRIGDICWACQNFIPKCEECNAKAQCKRCESGYTPLRSHHRVTCVPLCPRGQYYDPETQRCTACPFWCRHCDVYGCLECATGLYRLSTKVQMGENWSERLQCRYNCPLHYYPLHYFPYRCEPCHPSCWGCWGPTDEQCLDCKTVGVLLLLKEKTIKCEGSLNDQLSGVKSLNRLAEARLTIEEQYQHTHREYSRSATGAAIFVRSLEL